MKKDDFRAIVGLGLLTVLLIPQTAFACSRDNQCPSGKVCAINEASIGNTGTCQTPSTFSIPTFTPGSYALFDNRDDMNNPLGITRIEAEQGQCDGAESYMLRMTKSNQFAYWAGSSGNLRFCMKKGTYTGSTPRYLTNTKHLFSSKFTKYDARLEQGLNPAPGSLEHTRHKPTVPGSVGPVGMLGRLGAQSDHTNLTRASNSWRYLLFPGKAPFINTPGVWTRMVENEATPDSQYPGGVQYWHVELAKPTHGGILNVRFGEHSVENGLGRWSVIEDWEFDSNFIRHIQQRDNCDYVPAGECTCYNDPLGYSCDNDTLHPKWRESNRVRYYKADNNAFSAKIIGASQNGQKTITWGQPYELEIKTPSGEGYSGFVRIGSETQSDLGVWVTAGLHPIYVHDGYVKILPAAYGSFGQSSTGTSTFRVKQQVSTGTLSVDKAFKDYNDAKLVANRSGQAWSQVMELTIVPAGSMSSGGGMEF